MLYVPKAKNMHFYTPKKSKNCPTDGVENATTGNPSLAPLEAIERIENDQPFLANRGLVGPIDTMTILLEPLGLTPNSSVYYICIPKVRSNNN